MVVKTIFDYLDDEKMDFRKKILHDFYVKNLGTTIIICHERYSLYAVLYSYLGVRTLVQ